MNADSGDEHDDHIDHIDHDDIEHINQNQSQRFSPSRTFSTPLSAYQTSIDCTEPLNVNQHATVDVDDNDDFDMGTNTAPPINDTNNGHPMANNWDKFRLLMWKNSLLQWRHKVQTAVEILVPVLFSVILIFIRSIVDPDYYTEPTTYKPFEINTIDPLRLVKYSLCSLFDSQIHR